MNYGVTSSFQERVDSRDAAQLREEILDRIRRYYWIVHEPKQFVPFETRIQFAGRVFGETEMANLGEALLSFRLTLGPYGNNLEGELRRYFNARDCILVNSGSSANLLAMSALRYSYRNGSIQDGDEVITPAVTFPTTVSPIIQNRLVPVFVDCEINTYNIDADILEEAFSQKTRAMVIPHTLGIPANMDKIMAFVQQHNIPLIEDCCDALGSRFNGRMVGTFGEISTLSFYPAHHITTGEGGAVIVNSHGLRSTIRSLRDWGRDCWCEPGMSNTCGKRFKWKEGNIGCAYDHKYTYTHIGYNLKPTDLQAAVGLAQFQRLPLFLEKRKANFERIYEGLKQFEEYLILPKRDPRADPAWFAFPITVRGNLERAEIVSWLESSNVETRVLFAGNITRQPGYRDIPHRIVGKLTESDRIMKDTFFIGVYPGLSDSMINFVLERFSEFFGRKR